MKSVVLSTRLISVILLVALRLLGGTDERGQCPDRVGLDQERVLQQLARRRALLGINLQTLCQKVLEFIRQLFRVLQGRCSIRRNQVEGLLENESKTETMDK